MRQRRFVKNIFTFSEDDLEKKLLKVTVRISQFYSNLHSHERFQSCISVGSIICIFRLVKEFFKKKDSFIYISSLEGVLEPSGIFKIKEVFESVIYIFKLEL